MAPQDEELGTTETVEEEDYDLDSTGLEEPAPGTDNEPAADNAGDDEPRKNGNPALSAFYEKLVGTEDAPDQGVIPQSLRSLLFEETIRPELEKWQQGVDQQFDKIGPYRSFIDNGIPPEYLSAAVQLTQGIQENPQQALRDLADHVRSSGMDPAQILGLAAQVQQTQDATAAAQEEEMILGDDITKNPAFLQQQQELQQLREWQQTQQQEAVKSQYQGEIASTFQDIRGKIGNRPLDEQAVIQRAMVLQQQVPPDREIETGVLIRAAYQQWATERNEILKSARRAPRVGGGSSGAIGRTADEKPKPRTDEERRQAIVAMAERHARENGDVE